MGRAKSQAEPLPEQPSSQPWVRFQAELDRQGKGLQWLANRMGCSIQRVQNWTTRGVPKGAFPELAAALDKSVDWVAGLPQKEHKPAPVLSNNALLLAIAYDHMTAAEKMRLDRLMAASMDIQLRNEVPTDEGGLSGLGDLDEHEKKTG
jgi:hypothetical protein